MNGSYLIFRGSGACDLMEHKVHSESARRSSDTFFKSADGSESLLNKGLAWITR